MIKNVIQTEQAWYHNCFPGDPLQLTNHAVSEEPFPNIQLEQLWHSFIQFPHVLSLVTREKTSAPAFMLKGTSHTEYQFGFNTFDFFHYWESKYSVTTHKTKGNQIHTHTHKNLVANWFKIKPDFFVSLPVSVVSNHCHSPFHTFDLTQDSLKT